MQSHVSELIAKAKSGCKSSRGRAFEGYRRYLKTLARINCPGLLRTRTDPSDLVQETFLRAHQKFEAFRGNTEAELACWLRSVLASQLAKSREFHFAQKRSVQLEEHVSQMLSESSVALDQIFPMVGPSPSEDAENREAVVVVANAIEDLSQDYRDVILLRHVRGLPYSEVAIEMQRSIDSVKKLWVRALAQLQRRVEGRI